MSDPQSSTSGRSRAAEREEHRELLPSQCQGRTKLRHPPSSQLLTPSSPLMQVSRLCKQLSITMAAWHSGCRRLALG